MEAEEEGKVFEIPAAEAEEELITQRAAFHAINGS